MRPSSAANQQLAQERDLQRARALEIRAKMLALVKSAGHKSADEYNAAKMREFFERGKPAGQFTAAAYRDSQQ